MFHGGEKTLLKLMLTLIVGVGISSSTPIWSQKKIGSNDKNQNIFKNFQKHQLSEK